MADTYLASLQQLLLHYGYLIIFAGLILENSLLIGFLFPGVTFLLVAGYYAGTNDLNLAGVFMAGLLGTIIGDTISYLLGRYGLLHIPFFRRWVKRMQHYHTTVVTYTGPVLIFFHFWAYARLIIPTLMGIMKFPFKRWIILDSIGAFLFTTVFLGIGYSIGRTSTSLAVAFEEGRFIQVGFIGAFLFALLYVIWRLINQHRHHHHEFHILH
jgi:membrane protein DedA with SNARE-associated domain